jgi:predicted TIM-barrel fold metal-dependent hydrolase
MARDRIDVHTHYLGGAVGRWFQDAQFVATGGYRLDRLGLWSATGALEFMDRHEIATQILSVPLTFAGERDDRPPAPLTREINEEYAALIKDHPDRFGAFAAIPLDAPDDALGEIDYALDGLGLDGVLLTSNASGHYFGQPFFEPILAELSRRRVPVFVHPEDCPHIDVLGFGRPSSVIEFPLDTAPNITNALYTGVFRRHPGLRLILAHCGGVLPNPGLAYR